MYGMNELIRDKPNCEKKCKKLHNLHINDLAVSLPQDIDDDI